MAITKTPFRMSFVGGGTDVEDYFIKHGDAVLSTTFDKHCYVQVHHLLRFFEYSNELIYARTERVLCGETSGWQDQIAASFGRFNCTDFHIEGFRSRLQHCHCGILNGG